MRYNAMLGGHEFASVPGSPVLGPRLRYNGLKCCVITHPGGLWFCRGLSCPRVELALMQGCITTTTDDDDDDHNDNHNDN